MLTGLFWVRGKTDDEFLLTGKRSFFFHKRWGISWLSRQNNDSTTWSWRKGVAAFNVTTNNAVWIYYTQNTCTTNIIVTAETNSNSFFVCEFYFTIASILDKYSHLFKICMYTRIPWTAAFSFTSINKFVRVFKHHIVITLGGGDRNRILISVQDGNLWSHSCVWRYVFVKKASRFG